MSARGAAECLVRTLGETSGGMARVTSGYAATTVDVTSEQWVEGVTTARDTAGVDLRYFDWLSAVDEDDALAVVVHLWSLEHRHGLFLRARLPRERPVLASVSGVFAGAGWHERETAEMFGIAFAGHPRPGRLLLPEGFEGHPLRKDFVLAARVAKPWPGEVEPADGGGRARRRRRRPPGVPDDWGPR